MATCLFLPNKTVKTRVSVYLKDIGRVLSAKHHQAASLVPAVGEVSDFIAIPLRRVLAPDLHGLPEAQVGIVLKWAEAICTDILSS